MTEADYEERKRGLEAQLRLSIQFLQKGYEAQLRALELAWAQENQAPDSAPALEAAPAPQRPSRPTGSLIELVRQAVAQLPAEFKKEDVIRLLGFTPERSSLHRAMDELLVAQEIRIRSQGAGRTPNVYRKLTGNTPESP